MGNNTETTTTNESTSTIEYSPNAVTGSAEDALEGREVDIKDSSSAQKVTVGDDNETTSQPKPDTKETEEGKKAEEGTNKANETKEDKADEPKSLQDVVDEQKAAEEDLTKDLAAKGIDFDALADEYDKSGALSEKSVEKLEKAGYPRSVINAYIAGLEATAEKFVNEVLDYVGGADTYRQIANFVAAQPDGTADQFNALLERGNLGEIKLALDGFKARMRARTGTTGRSILGGGNGNTGANNGGFTSKAEMVKAMSDKRYGRDRAYTESVQLKAMNSSIFR